MPKAKYVRAFRPEEYRDILFTHGRRVANRVALASVSRRQRTLADFYACYAPEDGLPEHERCVTGLINKFDPAAWFVHYPDKPLTLWPAPEGDTPGSMKHDPDEQLVARQLAADIAQAARQIVSATALADTEEERDARGNAMLSTLASTLAAKYGHDSSHNIYNAIVDEINKDA